MRPIGSGLACCSVQSYSAAASDVPIQQEAERLSEALQERVRSRLRFHAPDE